ncbi:hypothetical protein RRG08_042329 [Elysia crispata]|uniref:Uncharacterized protein n=1 Tax=Elysia crispata TaxID=231223 RepID=A0AAE0ZKW9_9GAST|nr:hypothetical protein RRG08_042329 [Elysia crispata]
MATFPRSRQATHHVTILCKLQGLNFLLMLMILATDGNNDLIPTEVLCQSGWKQGDNFCFKVFDGKTEKQSYDAANQFCKDRNVELLSEDDVDTYHYTEKTFWVYGKKRGSCQYYKSSTKELIVIETDCKQNGTAVCKGPSQCPLEVSMLHITIGASVLAVIILLIVVAIIFICRKQAAKKRKTRDVPEDVTRHPTGDVQEYANAQVIRDAWSGSERESWDQGDDSEMIKEVKLSSNNAVYESLCADETEESHTYAN